MGAAITIQLTGLGGAPSGSVRCGDLVPQPFVGWLGLISALQRAIEHLESVPMPVLDQEEGEV